MHSRWSFEDFAFNAFLMSSKSLSRRRRRRRFVINFIRKIAPRFRGKMLDPSFTEISVYRIECHLSGLTIQRVDQKLFTYIAQPCVHILMKP